MPAPPDQMPLSCVIHGSFSRHFTEIQAAAQLFKQAGIQVLAPKMEQLTSSQDGFALFQDETGKDPRYIELLYLHNVKNMDSRGFSYFVNPEGYLGSSAAYELGIAQVTNVPCFLAEPLADHPAYTHAASVWSATDLADYIATHNCLPTPTIHPNEKIIHALWEKLMVPGSVVATGTIIEHQPRRGRGKEILLVKTHKWGGRYSIVGGKVRRNERLHTALLREVYEETGIRAEVGQHICTFDQIKDSGYYQPSIQHIFVDFVTQVTSKRVRLNEEAQDCVWVLATEALDQLDIEPNARKTIEDYLAITA